MSKLTKTQLEELAEGLNGTCNSLDEAINIMNQSEDLQIKEDDLSPEDFDVIEEITQRCDICSWWVDTESLNEDNECSNCSE